MKYSESEHLKTLRDLQAEMRENYEAKYLDLAAKHRQNHPPEDVAVFDKDILEPLDLIANTDAVLDCFDTLSQYVDFLWYDDETEQYKSIRDSNIILSEYFSAGSDTVYLSAQQISRFEQIIDNVLNRYGVELVAAIEVDRDVR